MEYFESEIVLSTELFNYIIDTLLFLFMVYLQRHKISTTDVNRFKHSTNYITIKITHLTVNNTVSSHMITRSVDTVCSTFICTVCSIVRFFTDWNNSILI